jgi:nucleoside-diphosphate-sugar epimerase
MNVLVTGASGLIGGHAAWALRAEGFNVTEVCRKRTADGDGLLEADLTEPSAEEIMVAARPEVIVHCAAAIPADFFSEDAERASRINRRMDDLVLRASSKLGARLIFCSSTSVYGFTGSPWNEDSTLSPQGAYATAKVETENKIAKSGLSHVILRLSSPYGPGQRGRTVLLLFIERAMQNLDLLYYGTGARQQDFIAAADVAAAVTHAVRRSAVSGIFNIASGSSISMKELGELILKCVSNSRSQLRSAERDDPQENYRAAFNVTKTRKLLGWAAAIPLDKGISEWVAALRRQVGPSAPKSATFPKS